MAKGILGIILCPMLEDELVYSLGKDKEIERLVILENEHSESVRGKLAKKNIKFETIPEEEFDSGKVEFDRSIFNVFVKTNDLALHAEPKDLRSHIEKEIRDLQPFIDALGLYYGLCGNYGWDITQWCKDEGLKPAAVFRDNQGKVCDDCIAVAVGGTDQYLKLQRKYTGMFYMTPAFSYNWKTMAVSGDDVKGLAHLPQETKDELGIGDELSFMKWMFEFCGYKNTLKIDTGIGDEEVFNEKFLEASDILGLKPLIIEDGWVTLDPAEAIYNTCKSYFKD